jgi:hypothetical protein
MLAQTDQKTYKGLILRHELLILLDQRIFSNAISEDPQPAISYETWQARRPSAMQSTAFPVWS